MATQHVFIAAGDACELCQSMHGTIVEPGFQPHDNCNCNTVQSPSGTECTFDVDHVADRRTSDGRLLVQMTVWVTCPDGTVQGGSTSAELTDFIDDVDTVEEFMSDLCEEYCGGDEGGEFLCC
jgi:hypothetical protein